jgi:hypothetical protein
VKRLFLCTFSVLFLFASGCTPGPLAFYPFSGNANDESGNGLHATVQGAVPASDRFGSARSAYRFDGLDDYIQILSAPFSFDGDFAFSFWESSSQSRRMHALGLGSSENDNLDFDFNDAVGAWVYWNGQGTNAVQSGDVGAFTGGAWHHLVLQRAGSDVELYVDGTLRGTAVYDGTVGSINGLYLGRGSFVPFWWDGSLDEVRVYGRSLRDTEIAALWQDRPLSFAVLWPNGGEVLESGSRQTVRWETGTDIERVRLEYTSDDGGVWQRIADDVPAEPGMYAWTVPEAGWSVRCRARVSDAANGERLDESDAVFTVTAWELVNGQAAFTPRDGAGALVFQGKMWLLGGWTPETNSEVWSSEDGQTWTLETVAPWEPRHTAGYVVHDGRMWIIGGDPLLGHYQNDVWSSPDGIEWDLVSDTVPWKDRVLHHVLVHDGRIWLMGGQALPQYAPAEEAFYNDVWCTEDGAAWTLVTEHAPWEPRGMIGGSVVFDGRMWILGGGTYDTPGRPVWDYYNDVWSSADGVSWTRVTEHAPWQPRQYHDVAVFDGRMWVMEGWHGTNLNDVWFSGDGAHWEELPGTPWPTRHASSVFSYDDALWMVAGNLWNDVWRLPPGRPELCLGADVETVPIFPCREAFPATAPSS